MSFFDRVTSLFGNTSSQPGTPGAPAEPPHALRQHFAVSTRDVHGFEVYSVAPMKFAEKSATDVAHYDPHADALGELSAADAATKAVLYVLPGGFAKPIQPRNWDFIGQLAEAGLRVEIPLYGLVPEHTCADALPLLRTVYEQLVNDHGAENITIVADSAGGSLALGLFIADYLSDTSHSTAGNYGDRATGSNATSTVSSTERPDRLPVPGSLILNAPWLDMDLSNGLVASFEDKDPILNPEQLRPQGALWAQGLVNMGLADSQVATQHPIVSPINLPKEQWSEVLRGTAVKLFCGDRDLSLPDTQKLTNILVIEGVDTELQIQPGAVHMYHLGKSREGRAARKTMISVACNTGS